MTRRDASGGARVAETLRNDPPTLDDLSRARMEKRLLERARASHAARPSPSGRRGRLRWAAGGALVTAAAAALALWPGTTVPAPGAVRFTLNGQEGSASVDTALEVREGERGEADVGHAHFDLGGSTRVTFTSAATDDIRLEMSSGEIEVAFHPVQRGRERLTVETPSARVEVVGTVFTVGIEGATTRVSVRQGVVRVVPLGRGASAVLVHAGGSTVVSASGITETAPVPEMEAASAAVGAGDTGVTADAVDVTTSAEPTRRASMGGGAPESAAATMAEAAPAEPESASTPPAVEPGSVVEPISPQRRLDAAQRLVFAGDHVRGRAALAALVADRSVPLALRLEAQSTIADSLRGAGSIDEAIAAYERVVQMGRGRDEGANAIFDIARIYDGAGRTEDARRARLRYLDEYPLGPNARMVRAWICAHGGDPAVHCEGATP